MTRLRPPARRATPCIVEIDLDARVTPLPNGSWVEAALAEHGVVHGDVANCVADAAVFAASEAIAEQGVKGKLDFYEINALHAVIKEIVVGKLHERLQERIVHFQESPALVENASRRELLIMLLTEDNQ